MGHLFAREAGKHCIQRIPSNDRSGRPQTSFVSVAVLPLPPENTVTPLPENELQITVQTGKQRAGGQNVNKVASAVRMKHLPTGLSVFIHGRDQGQNKQEARRILTAKVNQLRNAQRQEDYSRLKNGQLGERGRGGKIRTYNFIDGRVTDHRSGQTTNNLKGLMKGNLELLANLSD